MITVFRTDAEGTSQSMWLALDNKNMPTGLFPIVIFLRQSKSQLIFVVTRFNFNFY